MKMTGKIKKRGAAALACLLVVSAAGISSVYGAPGVEPDRSCSLSFELDGQYQELNEIAIPVNLYKVADVEVTGEYTSLAGYEELDLGSVSDSTTAEQWEAFSQEAVSLKNELGAEPTAVLEIAPNEEGQPGLDSPETIAALEYHKKFVEYMPSEGEYATVNTLFREAKAHSTIGGPWLVPTARESGIDLGLAPMPVVDETGKAISPYSGVQGLHVLKVAAERKHDAIVKVLQQLMPIASVT